EDKDSNLVSIIPGLQRFGKKDEEQEEDVCDESMIQRPYLSEDWEKRESKSLSDLEFEELKGFMDLGFVFSEEDKDSNLVSIIPGLQRFGKKDEEQEEDVCDESMIQRPYLSEDWESIFSGLKLVDDLGFKKVKVESDSNIAVNSIKSLMAKFEEIKIPTLN
ncbi:hypothetical protein RYX36_006917, partial [Vicia faba]